jgi:Peptidase propeptide and YPEB domain
MMRRGVNISPVARTLPAMRLRLLATLLLLSQVTFVSQPVQAQNLVDPRGRDHANQSGGMSLDEAVRMVESRYRARAVRAETVNSGGRRVHEIRLLNSEGRVWKVRVDAETGQAS